MCSLFHLSFATKILPLPPGDDQARLSRAHSFHSVESFQESVITDKVPKDFNEAPGPKIYTEEAKEEEKLLDFDALTQAFSFLSDELQPRLVCKQWRRSFDALSRRSIPPAVAPQFTGFGATLARFRVLKPLANEMLIEDLMFRLRLADDHLRALCIAELAMKMTLLRAEDLFNLKQMSLMEVRKFAKVAAHQGLTCLLRHFLSVEEAWKLIDFTSLIQNNQQQSLATLIEHFKSKDPQTSIKSFQNRFSPSIRICPEWHFYFILASKQENLPLVRQLTEAFPSLRPEFIDPHLDRSALMMAVEQGHCELMEFFLSAFPGLDFRQRTIKTGLSLGHLIARLEDAVGLKVARLLLEAFDYEAFQISDGLGRRPLHHAAAHNRLQLLQFLISAHKRGRLLDSVDSVLLRDAKLHDLTLDCFGKLPIHYAARRGHLEAVKVLLDLIDHSQLYFGPGQSEVRNALLTKANSALSTRRPVNARPLAFIRAMMSEQERTQPVKYLPRSNGLCSTPLHEAVSAGHVAVAQLLAERLPELMHWRDDLGRGVVLCAVANGRFEMLQWLETRFDLSSLEGLLHAAVLLDDLSVLEFLLERGGMKHLVALDGKGLTPLQVAQRHGRVGAEQMILQKLKEGKQPKGCCIIQ